MKTTALFLAFTYCSFAQYAVNIGPATVSAGLADATAGGRYISAMPANHQYVLTLATGTPNTFTVSRDGAAAGSPVNIVGSGTAQTLYYPVGTISAASWSSGHVTFTTAAAHGLANGELATVAGASPNGYNVTACAIAVTGASTFTCAVTSNPGSYTSGGTVTATEGVTVAFTATTGHTAGATVTIGLQASGSSQQFMPPGLGARMRSIEDMLRQGMPNVLTYYGADPTGSGDSTSAIQKCVDYGNSIGMPCYLPQIVKAIGQPAATYRVASYITLPAPDGVRLQAMGLVGDSVYQPAAQTDHSRGTQIWCTATYGSTGDPTQGCIRYSSPSIFSYPYIVLANLSFVGPDTWGSTTASGNAVMITGGASGPIIRAENLSAQFFDGVGTAAYWFDGPENNTLTNLSASYVNSCHTFRGQFNGTVVTNFTCNQTIQDGGYVENTQSIQFIGGTYQASQGTGLHFRGVSSVLAFGTHVEGNNTSCVAPLRAIWGTNPVVSSSASSGATSVSLSGLGSGTIPAGTVVNVTTPGFNPELYITSGSASISGGAVTLTFTTGLTSNIAMGAVIATPCTNGEAEVVIEAGYTGSGCDSHGRHCGYNGGFNQQIDLDHLVYNSANGPIGSSQALVAFANPVAGDGINYGNFFTSAPGFYTGGIYAPVVSLAASTIGSTINQQRSQSIDSGYPTTNNCFKAASLDDCPATQMIRGPITINDASTGNDNVLTVVDNVANPQNAFVMNHYNLAGVGHAVIFAGYNAGFGGSVQLPLTFDFFHHCTTFLSSTSCSGTYPLELPKTNVADLYVNGNHSIDTSNIGHFAAGTQIGGQSVPTIGTAGSGQLLKWNGTQVVGGDLSGDGSTSGGTAFTLASILSAGSCGDGTHSCQVSIDAKGRVTAIAQTAITTPSGAATAGTPTGLVTTGVTVSTSCTSTAVPSGGGTPTLTCTSTVTDGGHTHPQVH